MCASVCFLQNIGLKLKYIQTPFRGPKAPKRSIDTLKMDDSHFPAANSTVCTDSTYSSSIDSIQKKAKVEIGRSGTAVVTGPAVVTLNPTVKRRSGGNRANGPTSRRRQSRHHRQSILIEEKEEADSFFTPVQAEPTVKARKILGANESQISLEKADLQHRFTSSRVVTIETCRVCFKRIKFATKCHRCSVCRVTIHPECAKNLSLSCAEPSNTKTLTPGRQNIENFLLDKNAKPKIPPQVYLSVHAVDERLNEEGIYRQSGSTKSVQELKKNLLYGDFAEINFDETDVHVLCTFIKDFFRDQLSEPILTYKLLPSFIKNTKSKSQSDLKTLIRRLPDANRDTLAFMCVHLQNVTGAEKQNRMSTIALARSLGPSVVGYQSPNPSVDQIRSGAQYQVQMTSFHALFFIIFFRKISSLIYWLCRAHFTMASLADLAIVASTEHCRTHPAASSYHIPRCIKPVIPNQIPFVTVTINTLMHECFGVYLQFGMGLGGKLGS